MDSDRYMRSITLPPERADVVLDTDAYNEIDDQFAISYLIKNSDRLKIKALYAAPFLNFRSSSAGDGMRKSYDEILRLLDLMDEKSLAKVTFKGSDAFLADEKSPVMSDAAADLAKRAAAYSKDDPLYVIAIGAITNVASALLIDPGIAEKIVVVWLGGHSREFQDTREFNMYQDVAAARVVFKSGAPIVQLPCNGVVNAFCVPYVEMAHCLKGVNALCDFLVGRVKEDLDRYAKGKAASRVIWDVTAVAWLLNDKNRFMLTRAEHLAVPEYDDRYAVDRSRFMGYVYFIKRDALATDLFMKLTDGKCEGRLYGDE